jgi:hypothetical protein
MHQVALTNCLVQDFCEIFSDGGQPIRGASDLDGVDTQTRNLLQVTPPEGATKLAGVQLSGGGDSTSSIGAGRFKRVTRPLRREGSVIPIILDS